MSRSPARPRVPPAGPAVAPLPWHSLETARVMDSLGSGPEGLSEAAARSRLERDGPNLTSVPRRESFVAELVESVTEPLQLLLIAIAVLSALWGELRDAVAIAIIIFLVATIEATTEARAKRALHGLRELVAPRARVVRDRRVHDIPAAEVVAGDVIVLEAGDVVPADARVLMASSLATDESALTGEPQAAPKSTVPVAPESALGARSSVVFAGTPVVDGEGRAVVVATGGDSELGKLGVLVASERQPPTPLQRAMAEVARAILFAAVSVSIAVPLIGALRGQPLKEMTLAGLALAFATIPEELPVLVTVLLAVGGFRLAGKGALLRQLRAAETLGATTVLVTDKTGTLTENRLRVAQIEGDPRIVLSRALCCQRADTREPIELAIAAEAQRVGVTCGGSVEVTFPFDPQRKRMSQVIRHEDGLRLVAKGAPESIFSVATGGDEAELRQRLEMLTERGLRVIAVGERRLDSMPAGEQDAERELAVVGLIAFEDPLRPGVTEAVQALETGGVRTIVLTGDHPRTAAAVAKAIGLRFGDVLIGGDALARVDDDALRAALIDNPVIARATPADKLRVVRLFQVEREVVAVTGDGINDSPALARADVGVAMGRRGTELAREAADIVLTDDAYPTVERAVEGGRNITSQLRRAVAFYLGAKLALVAVVGVPLALGYRTPFEPVHIVLLELFMDLGASVAFVFEPASPAAMRLPPRDPRRAFLDREEVGAILAAGLALCAGVLAAYFSIRSLVTPGAAPAGAFATWLIGHGVVAWAMRSRPMLSVRFNAAFPLWVAAATGVALAAGATGLGRLVDLTPMTAEGWVAVAGGVTLSCLLAIAARHLLSLRAL